MAARMFWRKVRGQTSGSRLFAAYLVLVLAVAVAGPGLSVYAVQGGVPADQASAQAFEVHARNEAQGGEEPSTEGPVVDDPISDSGSIIIQSDGVTTGGEPGVPPSEPVVEMPVKVPDEEPPAEEPPAEDPLTEEPPVEDQEGDVPEGEPEAPAPEPIPMVIASVEDSAQTVSPEAALQSVTAVAPLVVIQGPPEMGWYRLERDGGDVISGTYVLENGVTIQITVHDNDGSPTFDFVSDTLVLGVRVKGGPTQDAPNEYLYSSPGVLQGFGLHAPVNPSNDKYYGLSHIDFLFGTQPQQVHIIATKFHDDGGNAPFGVAGNGLFEGGEDWLEGFTFYLYRYVGDAADPTLDADPANWQYVMSAISEDHNGQADFGMHDFGWYKIVEVLSADQIADGWYCTTGDGSKIFQTTGEWNAGLWFGNLQEEPPELYDLTVHKFEDLDGDGVYDEGVESLLTDPSFEFDLRDGQGVSVGGGPKSTSSGLVTFTGLEAGSYTLHEINIPTGWTATSANPMGVTVPGETSHVWFGNEEPFMPFTWLDLAITKLADKASADPGETVRYTLTYWNNGNLPATDYTIVDDFDERYVTVIDAAGGVVADGKITWTFAGPLAYEDGKQTITYTVRVKTAMPTGTTDVDNVVVISHPEDEDPENNRDDERVKVRVEGADEPFLPFTGGEFALIIGGAVAAAAMGLLFRRAVVRVRN